MAVLAVALLAGACTDPTPPVALSSTQPVVTATPIPQPATPTPLPTPTAEPTIAVLSGATPTPTPRPVAQPGLYNDRIRIAVIADVNTGGTADGLFESAWSGTLAWQQSVNDAGGIGGRAVELVRLDSRLSNHREVLQEVCEGDYFAIVGSQSLGDFEGAEMLGTADCNLADFPGEVYSARRAISPVTFVANPFLNDVRQAGPARYLVEQFPEASQNLALFFFTALQLQSETERLREMLLNEGMNLVFQPEVSFEEDLTDRIATEWLESGAESIVWNADPDRLITLLGALDPKPEFVLCEIGCYSESFLAKGGAAVEGVYTWIAHSPFDSATSADELLNYEYWLQQSAPGEGWSEISLKSWIAGRLFEEAMVNRLLVVEPEAFTRDQLVQAARTIEDPVPFTANGLLAFTSPGAGEPTPCFALMVVENGRWVQAYPAPPRDLDCGDENLFALVATRNFGLTAASATSSEAPEGEDQEPIDLENPEDIPE